jgi:hypothetical protein
VFQLRKDLEEAASTRADLEAQLQSSAEACAALEQPRCRPRRASARADTGWAKPLQSGISKTDPLKVWVGWGMQLAPRGAARSGPCHRISRRAVY